MSDEQTSPFYRIRLHVSEASTAQFKGKLVRDITVELGNQLTIIKNKDDAKNVEVKDIQEFLFDLWDKVTDEGHNRKKVFIDEEI